MRSRLDRKKLVAGTDVASVGIEMSLCVTAGFLLGHWLATETGAGWWLTLLCGFVGMGAAAKALIRVHRATQRRLAHAPGDAAAVPFIAPSGHGRWGDTPRGVALRGRR